LPSKQSHLRILLVSWYSNMIILTLYVIWEIVHGIMMKKMKTKQMWITNTRITGPSAGNMMTIIQPMLFRMKYRNSSKTNWTNSMDLMMVQHNGKVMKKDIQTLKKQFVNSRKKKMVLNIKIQKWRWMNNNQ
jgi:hypothetical protein